MSPGCVLGTLYASTASETAKGAFVLALLSNVFEHGVHALLLLPRLHGKLDDAGRHHYSGGGKSVACNILSTPTSPWTLY